MDASCQKSLPLKPLKIDAHQPVDRLNEPSAQVVILEREYLELKSAVGYWRAMHAKTIIREKRLQQTIKEQEGQIRDLRHRIFGKKSEYLGRKAKSQAPVMRKESQKAQNPSALEVSNPAVRGMDLPSVPIFQ
jgi:hypothetical protein